jgi:hypothetical protein
MWDFYSFVCEAVELAALDDILNKLMHIIA